ncbi:META domain-containing protein [Novosphingobium sp. BL-8H]|uniref:META domain-containing protein n=1 Tax=Novosphingobium sp. BL-8H TaxID=3127640 RepID=UPI0037584A56
MNWKSLVPAAFGLMSLGGCAETAAPSASTPPATAPAPAPATTGLAATSWKLVGFQSMDDAQGTTKPGEGRTYTLEFGADGALAMQLDCNRGRSTWSAEPGGEGGSLKIGPVASTRALCPQPDIGQMMAARLSDVASYTLRDGHLFLALKMDSGIFEFAPQ